jgi:hypothetical protein
LALIDLWLFVAQNKPEGRLIGMDAEDIEIAARWEGKPGEFVSALVALRFLDEAGGEHTLHNWKEHNAYAADAKARSEKARRAAEARWRARNGDHGDSEGCPEQCPKHDQALPPAQGSNAPYPSPNPDPSPNPEPSEQASSIQKKSGSEYPVPFEAAWKALPARSGTNPKRGAYKAWQARVRAGAHPDDILAGCQRYAAFCEATGKVGTEFAMQGSTFFGPDEHFTQQWDPPIQHQRNDDWQAKARRMGLEARDGESWDQFKNRVMQA